MFFKDKIAHVLNIFCVAKNYKQSYIKRAQITPILKTTQNTTLNSVENGLAIV